MFDIFLDIPAQSFLEGVHISTSFQFKETFIKLSEDPVPSDAMRILDRKEKLFRLRSNRLRYLYRLDYDKNKIVIIKIEAVRCMRF